MRTERERMQDVRKHQSSEEFFFLYVSAQTEAEGPGAERGHQTELEEAVGWKSLPQGREEEKR